MRALILLLVVAVVLTALVVVQAMSELFPDTGLEALPNPDAFTDRDPQGCYHNHGGYGFGFGFGRGFDRRFGYGRFGGRGHYW